MAVPDFNKSTNDGWENRDDFDDEYMETFGDSIIHEVFKTVDKTNCNHKNTSTLPGGNISCEDCGKINIIAEVCKHKDTYEDDNRLHICKTCGVELEIFDYAPEWRYYGASDNRSGKDPSRCHGKKKNNRGLDKTFDELGVVIPGAIRAQVEVKYNSVVGGDTVRGKRRKAIIAACLMQAYREFGEYRTSDSIRKLFDCLTKKDMSDGLSHYYKTFRNDRTKSTTPGDLLKWLLTLTGVSYVHYRKIMIITNYLKNSSTLFIRSNPQSVASSVIYFYLCLNPEYKSEIGITKNKFAEKAMLSDITLGKLLAEACKVSNIKMSELK
jgi:transcription initiation factor TFIIIB Brf1 subunit/transcription initiation factor TFIIB